MIGKILSRHSPTGIKPTIVYMRLGAEKSDNSHFVTHNLRNIDDVNEIVHEYYENESYRRYPRKGSTSFFHEIYSFHPDEDQKALSNKVMDRIIHEYINLRGKDKMYYIVIHRDNERNVHFHSLVSGLNFRTGLSARLTMAELRNLKNQLQAFHLREFPNITKSAPQHGIGKDYVKERTYQARLRNTRALVIDKIRSAVQEAFTTAKTRADFLESLRDKYNLQFYERGGIPTGLVLQGGMKVRFSKLDVDFLSKSPDTTAERKILAEIQALRESRQDRNRNVKDKLPQNHSIDDRQ